MEELLIFSIDSKSHAISLKDVKRVIRVVEITALPDPPSFVLGTINLSGVIIPAISLRIFSTNGRGRQRAFTAQNAEMFFSAHPPRTAGEVSTSVWR